MKNPKCMNQNPNTLNWENKDCRLEESLEDNNVLLCICNKLSPTTIVDDIEDVFSVFL